MNMDFVTHIRWIYSVWCFLLLPCFHVDAGDCSTGELTVSGGLARVSGGVSYGCHSGCPTAGPQVHVMVQNGGNESVLWSDSDGNQGPPKVTVEIKDNCTPTVPITLVLVFFDVTYWKVEYDHPSALSNMTIIVYKPLGHPSRFEGPSGVLNPIYKPLILLGINIGTLQSDPNAVRSLIQQLQSNHGFQAVTSFNFVDRTSHWELSSVVCCSSPKGPETSETSLGPGADSTSPDFTSSETVQSTGPGLTPLVTPTNPVMSQGGSAGGLNTHNTALLVGLICLLIVITAASVAIGCYFYRRKKKSPLIQGAPQPAEPNTYISSGKISLKDRDNIGKTSLDLEKASGEAGYEEIDVIPKKNGRIASKY